MRKEPPGVGSAPAVQFGPIASYLGVVKPLPFEARFEEIHVTRDPRAATSQLSASFWQALTIPRSIPAKIHRCTG
jgi:hypothetical protein